MPEKTKDKDQLVKEYSKIKSTLIFYSAPHDINKDLSYLYTMLGDRRVAVVKEITKIHERAYIGNLKDLQIENPKGEFVIVVEGCTLQKEFELTELEHINLYINRGYSKKDAIKIVAEERGVNKNTLYKYTIEN